MSMIEVPVMYSSLSAEQRERNESLGITVEDEPFVDNIYLPAMSSIVFIERDMVYKTSRTIIHMLDGSELVVPISVENFKNKYYK